jgi:hypothetical protein
MTVKYSFCSSQNAKIIKSGNANVGKDVGRYEFISLERMELDKTILDGNLTLLRKG